MYKLNILATNKCNAQTLQPQKDSPGICAFCFRQESEIQTDIEVVLSVVQRISELPFEETITVTGGEPLLSEFIVPLVKEFDKYGKKVSLHTNGILLEKYLDEFEGTVRYVSLPYDGHKPSISNYYRGIGYYDIQQKNLELLKKYGVKIGLHTLLTPYNYNEIEDMARTLISSDYYNSIWYWFIKNFKRMNMSLNVKSNEYMLDYSNYYEKVEKVRHICSDLDIFPTKKVKQRKPIFIDIVGNVYIFSDIIRKNALAGNILIDEFDVIESFLIENGAEK